MVVEGAESYSGKAGLIVGREQCVEKFHSPFFRTTLASFLPPFPQKNYSVDGASSPSLYRQRQYSSFSPPLCLFVFFPSPYLLDILHSSTFVNVRHRKTSHSDINQRNPKTEMRKRLSHVGEWWKLTWLVYLCLRVFMHVCIWNVLYIVCFLCDVVCYVRVCSCVCVCVCVFLRVLTFRMYILLQDSFIVNLTTQNSFTEKCADCVRVNLCRSVHV